MSCQGLGECCGPSNVNIFAFMTHTFARHTPLTLQASLPPWWCPENPIQDSDTCQTGYRKRQWTTTYDNSAAGVRVRTRTWELNLYTGLGDQTDTSTGDPTEYPVSGGDYTDWIGDGEWLGDNPEYVSSSATHLKVKHYLENRYNPSNKLVVTTEIDLTLETTWADFETRAADLYDAVSFATMVSNVPASASGGRTCLWFEYDENGDVICTGENNVTVEYDAFYQILQSYFYGLKSIRLPGITMADAGVNLLNPIDPEATLKLTETAYTRTTCSEFWPSGETPTEVCSALSNGASIEVSANALNFVLIGEGACPP